MALEFVDDSVLSSDSVFCGKCGVEIEHLDEVMRVRPNEVWHLRCQRCNMQDHLMQYFQRIAKRLAQIYDTPICIEFQSWHNRTEFTLWVESARAHFHFDSAMSLGEMLDWLLKGDSSCSEQQE